MLAKKGRRAAATALALIMTLGTLPSAAFAAPERDHEHNAFNDDGFYYDCSYTEGEDEEVQVCDEAPNVHIHDDSCEVDEETGEYLCDGADNAHEHGADCFETQSSEGIWDCVPYPYYTITFTDEESGRSADARLVPEAPGFSEEIPDFEAPEGMTFDGWRDADGDWADPMELTGDAQLFAAWTGGETPEPETNGDMAEAGLSSVSNELLTNGETLNITLSGVKGYWESSPGVYENLGPTEDIMVSAEAGEHVSPESLVIAPVEHEEWYFLFNGKMEGQYYRDSDPLHWVPVWDDIDYFFLREGDGESQLWAKYGGKERQITNPAKELCFYTDWPYSFEDLGSTGVEYAYSVDGNTVVEMTTDKLYCFNSQSAYERALRVNPELGDAIVKFDKDTGIIFFVKATQGYFPVAGNFTGLSGSQKGEIHALNGVTSGVEAVALSQGYSHQFYYHEFKSGWSKGQGIRGFRITAEKDDTEYTVTYHDGDKVLTDLGQKGTWNTELTIANYTPGGGMVLVGWSTMPNGDVRYHAGDKYTVMGENLDLYAVLEQGTEPGVPNVLIGKAAPQNAKVGEPFTYTLRVCNDGTAAADGVVLHDVIPEGLTLAENTLSAGQGSAAYDTGDRTLIWTVGTLAAQNEKPLSELTWTELTFNVTAQTAGEYTNTVTLPGTKKTVSVTTTVTEQTQPVENVTLRYLWNDGVHTDPVETKTTAQGSSVPVRDGKGMTRIDYAFLGWAGDAEAETPKYTGGASLTLNEDMDLYAVWTPRTTHYSAQFFLRLDSTIQKEDGTTRYNQVYYTPHGLMKGSVYEKNVSVPGAEGYITQGIEKNDLSTLAGLLGPVNDAIRTLPGDKALRKTIQTYFDVTDEELDSGTVGVMWYVVKAGNDNCPYHVDGVLYRLKEDDKPGPVLPKETSIQVVHEYWQAENGGAPVKVGASDPVTVDTLAGAKIIMGQKVKAADLEKVTTYDGHDDYTYTGYTPDNLTVPAEGTLTVTLKYLRGVDTYSVGGEKVVTGLSSLPQGYSVTLALKNGDTELDTVTLTAGDFTRMDDGSYRANFLFQARVEAGTYTIQETSGSSVGGYNGPAVSYQLDEYVESGITHTNTNQVTVGGGKEWSMVVTNAYTVINTGGDPGRDDDRDRDPVPSRRPVETPPPEVTPPAGNGEVIIPDEEVPLTDLPQEETIIEEPSVPLADTPDEDTGTVILDEGTPLGNLPQTGTTAQPADPTITLGLLAVSVSLAAAGLWLLRKREDGEA